MGGTGSRLRNALASGNLNNLQDALDQQDRLDLLERPLNRRRDHALAFALRHKHNHLLEPLLRAGSAVNTTNRDGETPLDIVLKQILPTDDSILHDHFCPFATCDHGQDFTIPEVVLQLLRAGACGRNLQRLVLHVMKDEKAIGQLCDIIRDLECERYFRVSGLLLQVTVWFHQQDNLRQLLLRGVNPENFWQAVFLPEVVPSSSPLTNIEYSDQDDHAEYTPAVTTDESGVQSLKFSFVQDWRADWDDGDNPSAQYRAALQLTPEAACVFARAAHRYEVLWHIVKDVKAYLPPLCDGPDIKCTNLMSCLIESGYSFSEEEMRNIGLKFDVDFTRYKVLLSQPRTLKHLSRLTIRFNLNSNVFHALQHLEFLPVPIRQYIAMDDNEVMI